MITWTVLAFLSGSLMFSYWLGLIHNKNIKTIGDGNPGAFNLWKAAGFKFGMAGIILDFAKGYVPIFLLMGSGIPIGYAIVPAALAPICGHAFSPFLKFKGGKSIAVTFGVWSALTEFRISLVYAGILAIFQLIVFFTKSKLPPNQKDSFHTVSGMFIVWMYLYIRHYPPAMTWIAFCNFLLLSYTNRNEFILYFKAKFKKVHKVDDSHMV